ncbi:MAG: amidase [Deltaproteobacteria bacterium]
MSTRSPDAAPLGLSLTLEAARRHIREREADIRAFVCVTDRPGADADAKTPLAGVPYSLKDVWDVAGLATTGGARLFCARIARESGPVHRAFEEAGAALVGKTNLSDLAMTPECASSLRGRTVHPMDPTRTPGGSSGGGAAAVACGMSAFDWGSDFGGSIRLPSAFCGLVGLRLSASSWPPVGHFPVMHPCVGLNGMGPLTATVADCRAVLDAVRSRLCVTRDTGFVVRGLAHWSPDAQTVGEWSGFEREVTEAAGAAGLPIERADLPGPTAVNELFTRVLAASFGDWFPGDRRSLEVAAVRSLAMRVVGRGTDLHADTALVLLQLRALAAREALRPGRATRERGRLCDSVQALWARGRVVIAPTSTVSAPRHGRVRATPGATAFVKLANLLDATALTIPWGRFPSGLPRGLQLVGPPGSERALTELALGP